MFSTPELLPKERNEALVWLRILEKAGVGKGERGEAFVRECDALCRIISASKKTAGARLSRDRCSANTSPATDTGFCVCDLLPVA